MAWRVTPTAAVAAATRPLLIVASRASRARSRFGSLLPLLLLLPLAALLLRWGQHAPRLQPQPPSDSVEQVGSHGAVSRPAESPRLTALYSNAAYEQLFINSVTAAAAEPSPVFNSSGDRISRASTTARRRAAGDGGRRLVLLFWTKFWGGSFEELMKKWGLPPNARCSRLCELAYDKHRSRDADVVLFHAADTAPGALPADGSLRAAQLWVLFSIEPPTLGYVSSAHDGLFNLTMTYRSDADIEVGYGRTEAIVAAASSDNRSSLAAQTALLSVSAAFAKRKPYAYWIASNCADPRMAYVRELAKHFRVDVFGKCGPANARPCNGSTGASPDWDCVEELGATYAFYLSFENSLCTDYITEKLWRVLASPGGAIPVVIGAQPNRYAQVAPPGSYVHAESFASPRDLAAHLTLVASSHDLFAGYHRWRERFRVHVGWYNEFALGVCRLCESAHDGVWHRRRPAKPDLSRWFSGGCRAQWLGLQQR